MGIARAYDFEVNFLRFELQALYGLTADALRNYSRLQMEALALNKHTCTSLRSLQPSIVSLCIKKYSQSEEPAFYSYI